MPDFRDPVFELSATINHRLTQPSIKILLILNRGESGISFGTGFLNSGKLNTP